MVQSACISEWTWWQDGHEFENVTLKEILHHDGCIVRDGVKGGSSGAIY